MCYNCSELTDFYASDSLKPKYLDYAFYNSDLCSSYELNTEAVETMSYAFYNSTLGLYYLACMDLSNCTDASHAFENVSTNEYYLGDEPLVPEKKYGICLHNLNLENINHNLNITEMLKDTAGFIYWNEGISANWDNISEQGKVVFSDYEKEPDIYCYVRNRNLVHKEN